MATTPSTPPVAQVAHHGYFADLYTFDWTHLYLRVPLICSISIALCLVTGVLVGHPSAGLIAGGGAMTVGFGINQRIADSRLWPMIAATIVMFLSTVAGMIVGHRGLTLLAAAAAWSFIYGLLTARAAGISWVGQQAVVTLLVTSAFPADLYHAFIRGLLILLGGGLQILVTSLFLKLLPELKNNLLQLPYAGGVSVNHLLHIEEPDRIDRRTLLTQLRAIPKALPRLSQATSFGYALRLAITVTLAAEVYRRAGVQSGYWIPMTALLVQKPAFFETLTRALLRIGGTLVGAVLSTFFLVHIHPDPIYLAILAAAFAFCAYATNTVNYGLFTLCLTSYIVFLLSLNQLPGALIAHRRAVCTITGGLIALAIHLDALRRHKEQPAAT
ncbi:FUSC family protein [Granulicella arctica]|uniref:FUSC family protein n=1 Tax=Granulicella arctica TaxID=940613 RepID=UPI0021E0FC8A|nr:FUSC family protein [Granulicella arctica]